MKQDNINYFTVGVFVLGMIGLLVVTLLNVGTRRGYTDTYYVHFTNITDIYPGSAVTYGGYQIGSVAEVMPHREADKTIFRLKLAILEGWKIPTDSVARITSPGLLADSQINIEEGHAKKNLSQGERIQDDAAAGVMATLDTVANEVTDISRNSLKPLLENLDRYINLVGDDLATKLPTLTNNLNTLVDETNDSISRLNVLLSEKNTGHFSNTLSNAEAVSEDLRAVTESLSAASGQLHTLVQNADNTVTENQADIRQTVIDLRQTMATVAASVDSITFHLESASRNADEFSRQLRHNPSMLLTSEPPPDEGTQ